MSKEKKQSFMGGVTVLAISTILVKICGALYKIPLGNILGDEGITHFNTAYNIYAFLLTLSTAGLPLALSKLVSEADSLGRSNQVRRCFRAAMALFLIIGAAGAIVGVSAGIVLAMLYMIANNLRHRGDLPRSGDVPESYGTVFKRLLWLGIPITIGQAGMSILNMLDQKIIMGQLQSVLGLAETSAASLFGQYTFSSNLYNLLPGFLPAVAISLVPAISVAAARRDHQEVNRVVSASFRLIAVLAIPSGVGLSVLAEPILLLLYPAKQEAAAAAAYHLRILGIASIFVCLMLLTNSIMQAHNKVRLPIYTMLIGGVVKVAINYLLVGNPDINIKGAPIGTLVCYALIALMNLALVYGLLEEKPSYLSYFLKPALASAVMGAAAWGCQGLFSRFLGGGFARQALATLLAIGAAVVVYAVLVIALRIITREDLKLVPKGEKIARILHIR